MEADEWIKKEKQYHIQFYKRLPVVFDRGDGCWLYDISGKRYLDLVAGIAVCILGHCHPSVVKSLKMQAEKLIHTSNLYYTTPQIKLAEKLKEITGMDKFFFCNSGAEAVEASLKIARKVTGKKKYIAFTGAFHGRTMGALSVTWKNIFRDPFLPLIEPVEFAEFNNINDLERKIDDDVAAVIVEPIQGEAGIYPAKHEFMEKIFELKNKFDFVVIFDEVQSGFGRTGNWFAKDCFNLQPDVMAMAKGMGSGFPIGGVGVQEWVAERLNWSEHASTFGGNPLACSVSLSVIETIEKEDILDNVRKTGKYFKNRLSEIFEDVRGIGLMLAAVKDDAYDFVLDCLKNGLLVNATSEKSLRFVPPLILDKSEVDYACEILEKLI